MDKMQKWAVSILDLNENMNTCVSIQDVYDKLDYLSSLGKTQTAAVQRDADIGVAEAERDAGIRVRNIWLHCLYC